MDDERTTQALAILTPFVRGNPQAAAALEALVNVMKSRDEEIVRLEVKKAQLGAAKIKAGNFGSSGSGSTGGNAK